MPRLTNVFPAVSLLVHLSVSNVRADPNAYLKPLYTEEGGYLMDHLRYSDILEEEQSRLPRYPVTVFKIVPREFRIHKVICTTSHGVVFSFRTFRMSLRRRILSMKTSQTP